MTRDELLVFLARCVRDRLITERRAAELLLAFDNGTLNPAELPEQEDSNLLPVLLLSTALLMRLLRRFGYSTRQPLVIPHVAVGALKEALRLEFQARARVLAATLAGTDNIAAWQAAMANLIKQNMIENAIVGAGRALSAAEVVGLEHLALEQMAFLARFADEIALSRMMGAMMSEAMIGARSELYGRMGLALSSYFTEQAGDYGPGWIVEYQAHDDENTCSACLAAEGEYLPTEGPQIGEVCYGGMRCRCSRIARYDPVAYARLTGEPIVRTTARRTVRAA